MYAYVELSNVARTDSVIQSLSWMNYIPNPPKTSNEDTSQENNNSSAIQTNLNVNNLNDGWLATGNTNHIVSVTFTSTRPDENLTVPDRTNFNLRGHRGEIRLVSWNAPYQKLATVDEKGVIFVWVKHDNRWSLELINERNHPAVDMAWSYDGRMTVICYEDGYVLVGSVTGQRYWSTVVNTPQAKLSAVTWMPDVSHVVLGTTSGNLILMDHHGNTTEDLRVSTHPIRQLKYSCSKFYPNAPDSNASKFVNDDYILACSFDNGQIYFMYGYQDSSPIVVNTELQNIELDWSPSQEILAVAGHRRLAESIFHNEIQFYTRRGEILHHVNISPTAQSLSAVCWAHDNTIVFAACGSCIYTVWVTHKPLPSMLTICQMRIKEYLLNNSLQNLDQLALPRTLRENLLRFYRSTIKGFLPDPKSLRSFVCYPLKQNLRLQCTMKRIDPESEQPASMNSANYSGSIYVLYLEYLGGLIPLLTAKRVSKICPDFIIFDPQTKIPQLSYECSLLSNADSKTPRLSTMKSRSNTADKISSIAYGRNPIDKPEYRTILHDETLSFANQSSSGCSSENDSEDHDDDDDDDDDRKSPINHKREKTSRKKSTSKVIKQKYQNKLCTIAANIWGTRFKFYGHSPWLPEVLGSVTYKTSFLHLQPRQMTVTVANSYHNRKSSLTLPPKRDEGKIHLAIGKVKEQLRKSVIDEDDDETINAISSSKANIVTGSIPIAPMSPQLANARGVTSISHQASSQTKKLPSSPNSSRCVQRISMNIASSINHSRHRPFQADSPAPDSSSTSPNNLSRSTSPAASIANFIRPISPPCIQMKEPLSPKFSRTSSSGTGTHPTYQRQCSPPSVTIPSMTNNIDASTASATTTLNIDDSSGYDSSENPNQRTTVNSNSVTMPTASIISTVPESCFEPETYRNLNPLAPSPQKKISLSDPTLNQINKGTQSTELATTSHVSASSLPQSTVDENDAVRSDNREDHLGNDDDNDDTNKCRSKGKVISNRHPSRHKYSSARHRMITCTSAMNESVMKLSSPSDDNQISTHRTDQPDETSFYVMQNRPPLWNEQSQVYQLDFGGRVTLESAKNFQIELKGKQVIQFGRIENNCYTLDFEWPFSPLQAFAVALANITQRLK